MKNAKETIIHFIKKETVLTVAAVLAVLSAFIVPPSAGYVEYIDFRVLGILLSLMIVMAEFQKNGWFDEIGRKMLRKTKSVRQLCLVLVLLCFFFSMLITNDVALITFVPFTMLILRACKKDNLLIPIIVLQTIAANLGSMLTPIGNPQNLYLYNMGGFSLPEFLGTMLPFVGLALGGLLIWVFVICRKSETLTVSDDFSKEVKKDKKIDNRNHVYMFLFVLSLLVVAKIIPYYIVLVLILIVTFAMDRTVLKRVDYSLLLTFAFFFIFTGNIGQMDSAKMWLQGMIEGRSITMGIAASQVISNVPAALLLSGFTTDYKGLLMGVNIGGLGTLIASMASLISYKIYAHDYNQSKGKYFVYFTLANLAFLVLLAIPVII